MHGALASILSLATFIASAAAQVPFAFDGHLDGMSLDTGGAFNAGGTISVNGYTIVIPKNFKFDFPAAYVPFANLFDGTTPKDFPSPSTNKYEVSVVGNQVDGKLIAGKVDIAELGLQSGTGKISKIVSSANKGESWIEIENGPRLFINDPNAVYSSGYDKYPFFTADDENPSITASTGYPMCIPRSATDPLCPASNRPSTTNRNFQSPNSMKMAPFIVGDYLTYSGVKVGDKDIACYGITANVGIFTPAGQKPAFLFVEDAIIGIITSDGNMEGAPSRFIGMASDPAAQINIYAIDVDPCTGAESERLLGNTSPRPIADDPRNKWEYRTNGASIGKYTREYRIKIASGQMTTDNNITAGQYTTPASEIIFPEVTLPGYTDPPLDFTNFGYLAEGSGPEEGSTNIFGGLSPWPGATAPAAKNCPVITTPAPDPNPSPDTPTGSGPAPGANAGPDIVSRPGVLLTLAGTNNVANISAANVAYKWNQTAGPAVTLSSTTIANPTFTVPAQTGTANVTRTFELTLTANGQTSKDTVDIITNNGNPDTVRIESYTWGARQSGTINVTARTNVVSSTVTLSIRIGNTVANMVNGGNGLYSYGTTKVNANTPITVTSSLKGTATRTTNTT